MIKNTSGENAVKTLSLNNAWKLHEAPLDCKPEEVANVLRQKDGWLDCSLPCDVHTPLIDAGIIKDPVLADYCLASEWIEHRSWWFVREIDATEFDLNSDIVELSIESIDAYGDIFINGVHIGTHKSAFYPFVKDIKSWIVSGKNTLCVRVTTGLEQVSDEDLAQLNWAVCHEESNGCPERGDRRRAFVRKPQYSVGWDWGPKVSTCGIVKGVTIKCMKNATIRGVNLVTLEAGKTAKLHMTVEIEQLDIIGTKDADLIVTIKKDNEICIKHIKNDLLLTSGINYVDIDFNIEDADLWWPSGYGAQPLYEIQVSLACEDMKSDYPSFKYGIRTVSLDTSRMDKENRRFTLVVNNVPIFCKGGDWIPADSIYARITTEKYDTLVKEAQNANFNMLRVWGGGFYENNDFYEACDKYGILLWHDFMFACSAFPDHQDWFKAEVERELDYQTKHLRNHPSLGIWCGNNENHWIFNKIDNPNWNIEMTHDKQYGLYTSNVQAKVAVRNNCSHIPYWNSSPYGGALPNDDNVGDTHHWYAGMMNPDMSKRIELKEYDKVQSRFVTEYGYPGPCPKKSIEDYFDGRPIDRDSKVWHMHTNTFEKNTVAAGIEKNYNVAAVTLGLDDYILYSGMVQSLMLGYSLEAIRFKDYCSGALFWMYNDTWGEVGWTIVDYYLRRKISFYAVKRALARKKLIIRQIGENIRVMGCNDSDQDINTTAEMGYVSLDGKIRRTEVVSLRIPAYSRSYIVEQLVPNEDFLNGVFAIIPSCDCIEPAWLRVNDIRNMVTVKQDVMISDCKKDGNDLLITVKSDVFVHGVHIKEDNICSDNYFDLLPGQSKTIRVENAADLKPCFYAVV